MAAAVPVPTAPIRVLVVDGHAVIRQRLIERLDAQEDMNVVAEAATGQEAVAGTTRHAPDVALIDLQLPDGDGLDLCRRIHTISPRTKCIIHVGTRLDGDAASAAGADAIVFKQLLGDRLLETIRRVVAEIPG